jgi:PAS domain S-box-containing protein
MGRARGPEGRDRLLRRGAVPWLRLISIAILTLFATSSAAAETKRVLMLFSNDSLLPAGNAISSSFRRTLEAENPDGVEIFTEFLDADRFPGPAHEARIASLLRDKYASIPIDLAIAIGPQALEFLSQRRASLLPGTPLVFAGVSERGMQQRGAPPNSTGVVSRFDPVRTLELALRLQPDARQVVVVTGASTFDQEWDAVAREELAPYADRLQMTHLSGLPLSRLLDELARLPPRTIVIYLTIFEDGTGDLFVPRDLTAEISEAASAPVYGVYEPYVGRGVVGGYVESFEAIGREAARIALRVLAGDPPEILPPERVKTQAFMVDWRQLRRWGLDEASLPPGTILRFKEPPLWEQYRQEILAVIVVVVLQSAFIVALLLQARRRRCAEVSLRESEERYRNVVETQTELICRYLPDSTLTFVNDAYCRYFSRNRDELVGRPFIELIPDSERAAALKHIQSIGRSQYGDTYEHQVVRPDGSLGWQQWTDRAIRNAEGSVVELQGIGRDITDLKIADMEVEQRRKEVTHLTRVAILGELSGALAHELNQPLTAILCNAQAAQRLLTRAPSDLAMVSEILDDIVTDDLRAGEVITRLRALLKRGEASFKLLHLNDVATEVLALARSELIDRHVTVSTRLTPGLPSVRGDRVQLQQVMLNLLLNACEAMGTRSSAKRALTVSTACDGDGLLLTSIADRGNGIPPDAADRLFEPFFTTKPEGLGLGLSICRSIIAAHGGRLWADNNPDGGATFTVALPAHNGEQS